MYYRKMQQAVQRADKKALTKVGRFIRKRSRSSIKRRKSVSSPGSPPHVHGKGNPPLKRILYWYDAKNRRVIIGPVNVPAQQRKIGSQNRVPLPNTLEFGGNVTIRQVKYRGKWTSVQGLKNISGLPFRSVNARYRKRPFMERALLDELRAGTIPQAYKGTVTG